MVESILFYVAHFFFGAIVIDNRNEAYEWVIEYVSELQRQKKLFSVGPLSMSNSLLRKKQYYIDTFAAKEATMSSVLHCTPGQGLHFLPSWFLVISISSSFSDDPRTGHQNNEFIWIAGMSHQAILDFVLQAKAFFLAPYTTKSSAKLVPLFSRSNISRHWSNFGVVQHRPWDSVILKKGQAEFILEDCERFFARKDWYRSKGIHHHRGYLLYGPPGCGKTSFISALASRLGLAIYVLNFASLDDDAMQTCFSTINPRSILILEDIDVAISATPQPLDDIDSKERSRLEMEEKRKQRTFSGLLNCLDGFYTPTETLMFFTTNNRERLPPALIRPGRVDVEINFEKATLDQAQRLYARFFPEKDPQEFVVKDGEFSMAELQQKFMNQ